jgi:predicted nuclease of predicted toxin-antitoxin system
MPKFLVDENLLYYFKLWHNDNFVHVHDLPGISTDQEIWEYAKKYSLVIISKDSDFSTRIMISSPPPKVILLKTGNLKIAQLYQFLNNNRTLILSDIEKYKLATVYNDRIESFE